MPLLGLGFQGYFAGVTWRTGALSKWVLSTLIGLICSYKYSYLTSNPTY